MDCLFRIPLISTPQAYELPGVTKQHKAARTTAIALFVIALILCYTACVLLGLAKQHPWMINGLNLFMGLTGVLTASLSVSLFVCSLLFTLFASWRYAQLRACEQKNSRFGNAKTPGLDRS